MSKHNFPTHNNVYIGPSKVHGCGIFVRRPFRKGETVYIIKGRIVHWNVHDRKSALAGSNWFGIGRNTWIDPEGGIGDYQNHSPNPNCGIRGRVTVCALCDIKKDEEITIDYAITEEQPLWFMHDNTATGKKAIVRSIQFLPREKFERYLPYIPRYFQKVYMKYHKIKPRDLRWNGKTAVLRIHHKALSPSITAFHRKVSAS